MINVTRTCQGHGVPRKRDITLPVAADVGQRAAGGELCRVERRLSEDAHRALGHHVLARQHFEQRRLAGAVGAHKEDAAAALNLNRHVLQHRRACAQVHALSACDAQAWTATRNKCNITVHIATDQATASSAQAQHRPCQSAWSQCYVRHEAAAGGVVHTARGHMRSGALCCGKRS